MWKCSDLFSIVSDRGQDGAQGFDTHGNVQEMSSKEEVVVVSKQRHQHVPHQIEEGLKGESVLLVTPYTDSLTDDTTYCFLNSHCQ